MARRLLTSLVALAVLAAWASPASAQEYSFRLDREVAEVYWNADGTMSLEYWLTFSNQPGAHAIDFVDVGLPTSAYEFTSMTADVDGAAVSISPSDYEGDGSGVAVVLGGRAIPAGRTGTVHVRIGVIRNVLFEDDEDPAYASVNFAPVWFGSRFVVGSTDLSVTFHLPPGVQPAEPRWHPAPAGFPDEPETALDSQARVTYTWRSPAASSAQMHVFGASFPRSYVPDEAIQARPTSAPIEWGSLIGILCIVGFVGVWIAIPALIVIANKRRKLKYMSPTISIEGHGIKRGLTAVEAATLLEQPLDKVMTMILFSVVRKGAATVTQRDPLEIEAAKPIPEDLRDYELKFVQAFQNEQRTARKTALRESIVGLVKSVSEKMRGFSRRETVEYYRRIVQTAWEQVQGAQTPEVQAKYFENDLEWTMLDPDYEDRSRRVFRGPVYVPRWWGNYDPSYTPAGASGGRRAVPTPVSGAPGRALPQLPGADFAARVAGGVQSFSSKVVGNIADFTSSVSSVTNPPPKVTYSSRSSGRSGGGCACACACAGCACACAGGGR